MSKDYKLSFTSNSLNLEETIRIAEIYAKNRDWELTKEIVLKENILKRKKEQTVVRELREIRHRLNNLTEKQLELLLQANIDSQKLLVLLAVCKTYAFIREFIVEVVRYKFILFQTDIYESDYKAFYDSKAAVHDKLNSIKDSTKEKIRRVLFTILTQADMINSVSDKRIIQPFVLPELINVVIKDDPELLKIFLVSDFDINRYIEIYGRS